MKSNYKKVLALLSKLGIRISFTTEKDSDQIYYPLKDNKAKIVYANRSQMQLFGNDKAIEEYRKDVCVFALHEIGHFIIAPKQRRRRKDYGIPERESDKYQLEEIKATMIENELKRLFGFKYAKNLYGNGLTNSSRSFIQDNKKKIILWWESEGRILAKTYFDLV